MNYPSPRQAHDMYCPDRGRADHVYSDCQVFVGMVRVAKGERKACLKIVDAVYPADGVEGCGCSSEISKRIGKR